MAITTTNLSGLYALGDMALNTEGTVVIVDEANGIAGASLSATAALEAVNFNALGISAITFRATRFNIPSLNIQTDTINFRGNKYSKPKSGDSKDDKNLSVTYRVDKYWKLYSQLKAWKNLIYDEYTGVWGGLDMAGARKTVYVYTMDANGLFTGESWRFVHAYPTNIGKVDFDQSAEGTPISNTVQFSFFQSEYKHINVPSVVRTV